MALFRKSTTTRSKRRTPVGAERRRSVLRRFISYLSPALSSRKKTHARSRGSAVKKNPRAHKIMLLKVRKVMLPLLVFVSILTLIFVAARSVISLKSTNSLDEGAVILESSGDVIGIQNVPVYPGAKFMFKDTLREDVVQSFLRKGKSAYVLPQDHTWDDALSYYNEELPLRGWKPVLSVDLADRERLPGEYWVFEVAADVGVGSLSGQMATSDNPFQENSGTLITDEKSPTVLVDANKSYGLRMYSKTRSVWYEQISYQDALSGLSWVVEREKEIDLILTLGSQEELPDSFPWKLTYPEMWDATIRESLLMKAPLVEFSSGNLNGIIAIEPISFDSSAGLESLSQAYVSELNSKRSAEEQFTITQSQFRNVGTVNGYAVSGTSSDANTDGSDTSFVLVFVTHPSSGIVYVISSFSGDEAYVNYVADAIQPR